VPSSDSHDTRFQLQYKDTEALVADSNMPQVDAKIVGRQKSFFVAADRQRIDMVSVSIGENSPRAGLDHCISRHKRWNTQPCYRCRITFKAGVVPQVQAFGSFVALR